MLARGELVQARIIQVEEVQGWPTITMHRSTQEALLHSLSHNVGERDATYSAVTSALRQVLPRPSPLQKPEPENWPVIEKQLPHLVSVASAYTRIRPRMPGSYALAELLSDVGYNVWDRGIDQVGRRLLTTAENVLDDISHDPDSPIRANIHLLLALIMDDAGITQRKDALRRRESAFRIRKKMFEAIPIDKRTVQDQTLYYNALNDLSCSYQQCNRFDEISDNSQACFKQYERWGNQDDIPFEYGKYYHQMAFVYAARGSSGSHEAIDYAQNAISLMEKASAASLIIEMYRFDYANILYQVGESVKSLREHQAVLEKRKQSCGDANRLTLQSHLAIGILQYHAHDLKNAEYASTHVVKFQKLTPCTERIYVMLLTSAIKQGSPRSMSSVRDTTLLKCSRPVANIARQHYTETTLTKP